jgi:fructose/tagatose bisphosphate aldolase
MERGDPKPGARPREEDFNPEMMDKALKDIQGNIRKHAHQVRWLEKKKNELGLELGRILTGGIQK